MHRTYLAGLTLMLFCALVFTWAVPAQAQTYTILHNFTEGTDGYYPEAGLTLYGAGNLYGQAGRNSLFRLRQLGTGWVLGPIYEFAGSPDGLYPSGRLTVGPDGALYGATALGGLPDCADGGGCGTIYVTRPPGTFCRNPFCAWGEAVLYSFNPFGIQNEGIFPNGGLVFDAARNLYGTTTAGGATDQGIAFELSPAQGSWTETILYSFSRSSAGGTPNGNLVIDRAGNLYGTTFEGGDFQCYSNGCGVVFELSPTSNGWVETVLHAFHGGSDGEQPGGGLIMDRAGNIYGGTTLGGVHGGGTVFELTPSNGGWTYNVLYSLTGIPNADLGPMGILAIDAGGNLYGCTGSEGAYSLGNVFKLSLSGGSWTYTDLHDFAGGPTDGHSPCRWPKRGRQR
jgi:uncharacterized repeat protein (TIGR03803 family)